MLIFIPRRAWVPVHPLQRPRLLDEALHQEGGAVLTLTLFAILAVIRQASQDFELAQQPSEV